MPVLDEWDDAAGDWKPDEIDRRVRAVIEYRNRVADSVPGPVPEMGTPEWAAADWRTQLAAYARHERDVAAAQGKAISNRLAAEAAERRAVVEASNAVSAAYRQDGHANRFPLNEAMRRSREVVVPFQRTAESVARAREACRAARRQEDPVMAEDPPAAEQAWVR